MSREDRWDTYIRERVRYELENFHKIDPVVDEFIKWLREEDLQYVLDLGCGIGKHCYYLAHHGFKVSGLDISDEAINIAEKNAYRLNFSASFHKGDFVSLPFHNESFDAILAVNTLHHDFYEGIVEAIREVYRVLRREGLLCMNPPSVEDGYFGLGRQLGEKIFLIHNTPHYFFEEDEIVDLLERNDLKIEKLQKYRYTVSRNGSTTKREKILVIARKISKRNPNYYKPVRSLL